MRVVAASLHQVQFGGSHLPQAHILKMVGLHSDKGQQAWGLGLGSSQRQPWAPLYGAVQGPIQDPSQLRILSSKVLPPAFSKRRDGACLAPSLLDLSPPSHLHTPQLHSCSRHLRLHSSTAHRTTFKCSCASGLIRLFCCEVGTASSPQVCPTDPGASVEPGSRFPAFLSSIENLP